MKKVYYEKIGRRYVPVAEYDSDLLSSLSKGAHLVVCYPGGTSRMFNINPAFAPMIAAGRFATDEMAKVIMEESSLRLPDRRTPITPEQKEAWDNLVTAFGDEVRQLEWPSAREAAEMGVKAMQEEATKTLKNPAVLKAWEYFMNVYELTKEQNG